MGGPRRERERKPARRKPHLDPKPVILVVCEGEVTEPQYLRGFRHAFQNPRVQVVVSTQHGVPKTVVEIAKELKEQAENAAKREDDENALLDSVWAVFDVDDHPKINDAVQQANANGIHLAISNPAIELWLLLHFTDFAAGRHRAFVRGELRKFITGYNKGVDFVKHYSKGYADAVSRAKRLDETARTLGNGNHQQNPSTGFYRLTEYIRQC